MILIIISLQDTETVTQFFVYVCQSQSRSITLGVLYGYKMVPQVIALVCAFSIRKIKVKGLDDAKFIAFSVYITSLVTAIVIVITYTLDDYINYYASIFCSGFFIGTTVILGLVMIPPVSNYMANPHLGEFLLTDFPPNSVWVGGPGIPLYSYLFFFLFHSFTLTTKIPLGRRSSQQRAQ